MEFSFKYIVKVWQILQYHPAQTSIRGESKNIPEEVCESKVWLKVQPLMERGIHWLECVCMCLSMFEFRKEVFLLTKYT